MRYTIIDEADELVSPDWVDDMDRIMACTSGNLDGDHHYMMFSATFPREARALAKRHLADDHMKDTAQMHMHSIPATSILATVCMCP